MTASEIGQRAQYATDPKISRAVQKADPDRRFVTTAARGQDRRTELLSLTGRRNGRRMMTVPMWPKPMKCSV